MTERLQKLLGHPALEKAASNIKAHEGHISIVSHYDTDGICSGTIMLKAMLATGRPCSLRLLREFRLEEMERALGAGMLVLLDMGTGQLRELETLGNPDIIILDHHQPPEPYDARGMVELNAHKLGFDGTYGACASTLAYVLALKLDPENARFIGDAIIGIIGDRQHFPSLSGLNREIAEDGTARGLIKERRCEINLHEYEVGGSLVKSTDPYFTDLSGREDAVSEFLAGLGIAPDLKVEDLDDSHRKALTEALLLRLLRRCNHVTVEELICTRYYAEEYPVGTHNMSEYVNACGRTGNETLGVKMLLGNNDALAAAISLYEKHRSDIQNALLYLEDMGTKQMDSIQYFVNKKTATSGTLAGIGMQYIFDQSKPTLGMAEKEDVIKISGRGTVPLVERGLDLASALKEASSKVEGNGGGHPIAAGATILKDRKEDFLREMDSIVKVQLG